jgi:hypothetical protein
MPLFFFFFSGLLVAILGHQYAPGWLCSCEPVPVESEQTMKLRHTVADCVLTCALDQLEQEVKDAAAPTMEWHMEPTPKTAPPLPAPADGLVSGNTIAWSPTPSHIPPPAWWATGEPTARDVEEHAGVGDYFPGVSRNCSYQGETCTKNDLYWNKQSMEFYHFVCTGKGPQFYFKCPQDDPQ